MKISRCIIVAVFFLLSACDNSSFDSAAKKNDRSSDSVQSGSTRASSSQKDQIKDYETARPLLWRKVYPSGGESLYCGERFNSSKRKGFNVEHVFPMSWASNGLNCGKRKQCRARSAQFNLIEADLHNLFPSRSDVNQDRSSYRFGEVSGEARKYGSSCDFEVNERARVAEPRPSVRGDVARAMFYMADRYKENGLVLFKKQAKLLESWHKSDPPSKEELRRNDIIEKLQGNRNRFIDEPEYLQSLIRSGHFF